MEQEKHTHQKKGKINVSFINQLYSSNHRGGIIHSIRHHNGIRRANND